MSAIPSVTFEFVIVTNTIFSYSKCHFRIRYCNEYNFHLIQIALSLFGYFANFNVKGEVNFQFFVESKGNVFWHLMWYVLCWIEYFIHMSYIFIGLYVLPLTPKMRYSFMRYRQELDCMPIYCSIFKFNISKANWTKFNKSII